jgi:hypothetical protein
MASSAVTTNKIADGAVSRTKLANDVLPALAFALVGGNSQGCTFFSRTSNIVACTRTLVGTYEFTLAGEHLDLTRHVSVVTAVSSVPLFFTAFPNDVSGKLHIQVRNSQGGLTDGAFQFVTYELP